MKRTLSIAALSVCFGALGASHAFAADVVELSVIGPRVRLDQISKGAADVDLGPAPPAGGSRILERAEIQKAAKAQGASIPSNLPASIRITRRMHHLTSAELEQIGKSAAAKALPSGATIARIRVASSADIPAGYDHVSARIPRPVKRPGKIPVAGVLVFASQEEEIAQVPFVVDLQLSPEAMQPDVTQGSPLTILVKRGLVELQTTGTATTDADIGAIIPVTMKPSGKVVRAKITAVGQSLLVEGPN